jgi:hypothetical protein
MFKRVNEKLYVQGQDDTMIKRVNEKPYVQGQDDTMIKRVNEKRMYKDKTIQWKVRLYADEYNGVIKKKILANRVMTRMGLDDNLRERCI